MTTLPPATRLSWSLLSGGVPPSLLIDLLDPEGMRMALAAELVPDDVRRAPAPTRARRVRTA